MYADPHEIRALARRIREQGGDVRADADDLRARSRAVVWTGMTGAAVVAGTARRTEELTGIVAEHEAAARALERHAAAVEDAMALVVEVERRVRAATEAARDRVHRLLAGMLDAIDPADEVLARFSPPAPGSPDWLRVRLPGVAHPGARG